MWQIPFLIQTGQAPLIFRSWSLHLPRDSHLSNGSSFINLLVVFVLQDFFFLSSPSCKEVIHLHLVHFFGVNGGAFPCSILETWAGSSTVVCSLFEMFWLPSLKERPGTRGADWLKRQLLAFWSCGLGLDELLGVWRGRWWNSVPLACCPRELGSH